jgi:uncharacterized cupin superfamily protein
MLITGERTATLELELATADIAVQGTEDDSRSRASGADPRRPRRHPGGRRSRGPGLAAGRVHRGHRCVRHGFADCSGRSRGRGRARHEGFFILEGEVEYTVGVGEEQQTIVAKDGASVWIPRGTMRDFKVRSETARALDFYTPGGFDKSISHLATTASARNAAARRQRRGQPERLPERPGEAASGLPGDLVVADVEPALGHELARCLQDASAVALGVAT